MKSPEECSTIEEIRQVIDALDRDIIALLGRRFDYVKAITRFKKTEEDVRAHARYQEVLQARRDLAVEAGLDPDIVEEMYRLLIAYFIDAELKALHLTPDQDA